MSDITIVTAFVDIGRTNWEGYANGRMIDPYIKRSTQHYLNCFERLAALKNDMVVYVDERLYDRVNEIANNRPVGARTSIIGIDLYKTKDEPLASSIQKVQKRKEFISLIDNPQLPEYWSWEYIMINFLKTDFVNFAFDDGLIKTELAAWIDFGYARDEETVPKGMHWQYDFDPACMHFFNIKEIDHERPIFDIVKTNTVYIMGCHMVGGREAWRINKQQNYASIRSLLSCGLIDDDQTIMLMNYRAVPSLYKLHPIDESKGWFVIFRNFQKMVANE